MIHTSGISEAGAQAIGYTGGGILAICLIPQIAKIIQNRSANDIALSWALLYLTGISLTLVYLIIEGAIAAWIPLVIELAGSITILILKILFEYTSIGRRAPPPAAAGDISVIVGDDGDAEAGPLPPAAAVPGESRAALKPAAADSGAGWAAPGDVTRRAAAQPGSVQVV